MLLEFAIAAPALLLFLEGTADFGLAVYNRSRLAAGVSAGAEYAVLKGSSVTASAVQNVITGVSGLTFTTTPSVTIGSYCIQSSPAALVAQSSGTCADGTSPAKYAVISASYTSPMLVALGTQSSGLTLTESAWVGLQ